MNFAKAWEHFMFLLSNICFRLSNVLEGMSWWLIDRAYDLVCQVHEEAEPCNRCKLERKARQMVLEGNDGNA